MCRGSVAAERHTSGRGLSRYSGHDIRHRSKSGNRCRNQRGVQANYIDGDPEAATEVVGSMRISSVQVCKPGAFKEVRCCLVQVSFLLKLGVKVSIMSGAQYESTLKHVTSLQPPDIMLRTYSGQPIECLGCMQVPVLLDGVCYRRLPSMSLRKVSR